MIYLNSGTNSIVVTLYEKSSQTQPYYTWELIRKGTFESVIFYQDDTSYAPWYWNSFTISVGQTVGLTAGMINVFAGEYTYNVYEMTAPYILSITQSIGLVETGICMVSGTYSEDKSYTDTNDSTIKYYKNM